MLQKITTATTSLLTFTTLTLAHTGEEEAYYEPMMMADNGSWMHNGAHMAGYNMWGMGWFGIVPGLLIWILVILGIIFLYQRIMENSGAE